MKQVHARNRGLTSAIAVTTLLAFSNTALAAKPCVTGLGSAQEIVVLVPAAGDPKFYNDFCSGKKAIGSVCNGINKKPDFKFKMDDQSGNGWKFVRIELSGDGANWPGTLPAGAYSDFEFDSDEGLLTGRPAVDVIANGAQMKVKNNNCHAFTVDYRVVLKNSAGDFKRLHPVIENSGTED